MGLVVVAGLAYGFELVLAAVEALTAIQCESAVPISQPDRLLFAPPAAAAAAATGLVTITSTGVLLLEGLWGDSTCRTSREMGETIRRMTGQETRHMSDCGLTNKQMNQRTNKQMNQRTNKQMNQQTGTSPEIRTERMPMLQLFP